MYEFSRSAVFLEGEKSDTFSLEQGVAQGCSLSPILFSVFINDLLVEVEKAGLGVQLNNGKSIGGLLFADDFVDMSDLRENLLKLIDVVHKFCNQWRLKANVSKCAVVVFSKSYLVAGHGHTIPQASSYCYLGIDFTSDGGWDTHVKRVISNGREKVNQLHSIISNKEYKFECLKTFASVSP